MDRIVLEPHTSGSREHVRGMNGIELESLYSMRKIAARLRTRSIHKRRGWFSSPQRTGMMASRHSRNDGPGPLLASIIPVAHRTNPILFQGVQCPAV
jgi:hypothetical protein